VEQIAVRAAAAAELDQLAQVWFDGWHDAHAAIVPEALTRVRTLPSFRDRLRALLPYTRTVGATGAPLGFCVVKDDEVYQLFVAAAARGTGVAAALLSDAESRLASAGVSTAWLACAIGNERAARFYEKSGWRRTGTVVNLAETSAGAFALDVWRYEKQLTARPDQVSDK
jgi:GNAT superfamily N-acetyltransferase